MLPQHSCGLEELKESHLDLMIEADKEAKAKEAPMNPMGKY